MDVAEIDTVPDWLAELEQPVVADLVPYEPDAIMPIDPKAAITEKLKSIEEKILNDSMAILGDSLSAREITPETEEPPVHWVDELGYEGALTRLRIARANWRPEAKVPHFVKLASHMFLGIQKIRSGAGGIPQSLNVAVFMSPPAFAPMEEMEVEK